MKEGVINSALKIRTDEFKERALAGVQTSAAKRNRESSSVTEISDKTIQRLHRKLGLYIENGEVATRVYTQMAQNKSRLNSNAARPNICQN